MRTVIRIAFLSLLNLATLCGLGQTAIKIPTTITKRPVTVDENQIEVNLIPDKSIVMLGEPTYLSFVVDNHSDQDLQVIVGGDYRNALGRPESFSATVLSGNGKTVQQPDAGPGFGGKMGPQKIPAGGSYTFRLFLPDWATFTETGIYSITFRRELNINGYGDKWDTNSKGTMNTFNKQATVKLEIIPQDEQKIGELIDSLGEKMLDLRNPDRDASLRMLSSIPDKRVIPYYLQAFDTNNANSKIIALRELSKFDDERAFQILKEGMGTRPQDVHDPNTAKGFEESAADDIRLNSANALAHSKYPDSIPFLLTHRSDKYEGVRITILHVLGKMDPVTALPILREMTSDKSTMVSHEAKRYMQLLCEKSDGHDPLCGKD